MKENGLVFKDLRDLLLRLGFAESLDDRGRSTFLYPRTETFLLFRAYEPKETVSARDMVAVRKQLVDNGLIKETAFDRFLQKASA